MNNLQSPGGNSLNTIRLLACIQVLLGHFQPHLGLQLPDTLNFIADIFKGVPIFFILSGYLIYISLSKQQSWNIYVNKRILRLYPELWICVIFELISIALFYDQPVPLSDYLKFALTQGSVFQFWTPESMRGYATGAPNGSLWTITVIVQFYILIFFAFKFLKKFRLWHWGIIIAIAISWPLFVQPALKPIVPTIPYNLIHGSIFCWAWMFLIGAFIAKFRDGLIPILKRYWYVCLFVCIVLQLSQFDVKINDYYRLFRTIVLGMFIFGVAYRFPNLNIRKDISYGVYIYHMVFANAAIELGYKGNWNAFVVCIILTFATAYISFSTIGYFSNKKKAALIKSSSNLLKPIP